MCIAFSSFLCFKCRIYICNSLIICKDETEWQVKLYKQNNNNTATHIVGNEKLYGFVWSIRVLIKDCFNIFLFLCIGLAK